MTDIDKLYNDTEKYIEELEFKFLNKYLTNPTSTPIDFNNDVKSYCILSHAAFEDFVETLALAVMEKTIHNFTFQHKITQPLITLMHFKSTDGGSYLSKLDDNLKSPPITSFDYIREELKNIKNRFGKEIYNNHGVSLKYLLQMLIPLSIDVVNDVSLLSSLDSLAKERGFYAHKFLERSGTVKRSIAPEYAKTIVADCLKLCDDIRIKANAITDVTGTLSSSFPKKNIFELVFEWLKK